MCVGTLVRKVNQMVEGVWGSLISTGITASSSSSSEILLGAYLFRRGDLRLLDFRTERFRKGDLRRLDLVIIL